MKPHLWLLLIAPNIEHNNNNSNNNNREEEAQ